MPSPQPEDGPAFAQAARCSRDTHGVSFSLSPVVWHAAATRSACTSGGNRCLVACCAIFCAAPKLCTLMPTVAMRYRKRGFGMSLRLCSLFGTTFPHVHRCSHFAMNSNPNSCHASFMCSFHVSLAGSPSWSRNMLVEPSPWRISITEVAVEAQVSRCSRDDAKHDRSLGMTTQHTLAWRSSIDDPIPNTRLILSHGYA